MIQKMDKYTKHEVLKKAAELCDEIKIEPGLTEIFTAQRKSVHRTKKAVEYLKGRNIDSMKVGVGYNSYQSGYKQLQF